MTADLKHLHHLLQRNGLTVSESVAAMHAGSFLCGLIGFAGWKAQVPESIMFAAFMSALVAFVMITIRAWERLELRQAFLQRT